MDTDDRRSRRLKARDLADECLERMASEGPEALERMCAEHPEMAKDLRRILDFLDGAGLLQDRAQEDLIQEPENLGDFRILKRIGSGGMGVVYLAEQQSLGRQVAIKMIKLGMDSHRVLQRFRTEQQALARMESPYVAKVLDADATEDGRPYFVMEYVDGTSLLRFCEKHHLDIPARLRLFQKICAGVQHAHQKGVIHRDLKPSNILVLQVDGVPTPRIIDFGLARAMDPGGPEETRLTRREQILGTLLYMSPEQAALTVDVDTRSDVYALGVLLYELLTGQLPHAEPDRPTSNSDEIRRRIREEEPLPPSQRTRLSKPGLARRLIGDLDWICLKALEKDRERRYPSPADLASDIERHLEHEPVQAGPPALLYRIQKFLRRYAAQVAAAAAILLTLVLVTTISTQQYLEAEASRAVAEERTKEARGMRQRAESKADEARLERHQADLEAAEARERRQRFNLLANAIRLREVLAEEEKLYPAWPEKLAPMQSWLDQRALPLAAEMPRVRRTIGELEKKALPGTPPQGQLPANHPVRSLIAKLEERRLELETQRPHREQEHTVDLEKTRKRIGQDLEALDRRIEAQKRRLSRLESYRFENATDRFLFETLLEFLDGLEALTEKKQGAIAWIQERIAWASSIREKSITLRGKMWKQAITAIKESDGIHASKLYSGLTLSPQLGLLPMGMDPESKLWEFAHLRSGAMPQRDPKTGRLLAEADSGLVFVLIPGGTFHMGAQNTDPDAPNHDPWSGDRASPVRRVTLAPFFLSKYEMTQEQWYRLSNGERPSGRYPGCRFPVTWAHPVEMVSWKMCDQLLRRHSLLLPTGAQWEYACRAGTTTPWSTGEEPETLQGYANIFDLSLKKHYPWAPGEGLFDDGYIVHASVGSFNPNGFGLFDMHGNICEWCQDVYASHAVDLAPGTGLHQVASTGNRVGRGGSWLEPGIRVRSSYRMSPQETTQATPLGLRPARKMQP